MSTLTGKKISNTYKGLLKTSDEGVLSETPTTITDGDGNNSGVSLDTNGNIKVNNTVEFGSLKDSAEDITINKFVDEADGIENNDNDVTIPTSAAVKNYVDASVTSQDLDFQAGNGTGSVDLDSEFFVISGTSGIATSTSGLNDIMIDGNELQEGINDNATDIATNTTNIATNTTNIATNTTNIATNVTNITSNADDIADLDQQVDTNRDNISVNTTNIANNATNIATNVTNIANNALNISTNTTNIATNAANIATNETAIESNRTDISTNTTNIATNVTNIATNTTNIATNVTNIAANADNIADNTNDIAQNALDIANKVSKSGDTMDGILTMDKTDIIIQQGNIISEADPTDVNNRNFGIFNGAVNAGELNILVSNDASSSPVWADKREVTIDYRGWLGLGVTPTDELHLEGNFRLNKGLKLNQVGQNTFAGVNTGNLPNITGSKNVAFGRNAFNNATTASQNTAVGFDALKVSNSNNNTAVGFESMKANTTGSFNTALGWKTNQVATVGNSITSIGANAQGAGTPGNNSTAVGRESLLNNNAANNTAVGRGTLVANTSGNNQTAIGVGALATGTGGAFRYNTAIGANAGSTVQGQNNTLIGYNASPSATNANNEVTLGNSSVSVLRCAVTSITSLSDERDKTDIDNLEYGLEFINSLEPRQFVWNNRPEYVTEMDEDGNEVVVEVTNENNGKKDFGFIAQEVQEVDNDVLRLVYQENPDKLEMSYGKLVPILVKAIQQLTAEVEALKK